MASYSIGDLVVLKSGSMRMVVEAVDGDQVACLWCHEGEIGRDNFDARLLNVWEVREDHRRDDRGPPRGKPGGGKPYGGDRDGGGKSYGGKPKPAGRGDRGGDRGGDGGGDRGGDRDDRPKRTGFDGKPREKKYFRAND